MWESTSIEGCFLRKKIFIGLIFSIFFGWYLCSMVLIPLASEGYQSTLKLWFDWQTFNAGMIALLAAAITAGIAIYLDTQARKLEKERIQRESKRNFIAARAFLPHALADIDTYARQCSTSLRTFYLANRLSPQSDEHKEKLAREFSEHAKPRGFEPTFRDCIKYAGDENAEKMTQLLVELQVFLSRMSEFETENNIPSYYVLEMMVYSIHFQFRIDSFYGFARKGTEIELTPSDQSAYYVRLTTLGDDHEVFSLGNDRSLDDYVERYSKLNELINY